MSTANCVCNGRWHTAGSTRWCPLTPSWVGTVLESCIRDVALSRIASHSSVTAEMVAEWRRLNPGRVTR